MDLFVATVTNGLSLALQPQALLLILIGTIWGLIVGALPGVSGAAGVAILLPFLYGMEPTLAVMLLAGAFISDNFSNAIPAILIRTPGKATGVLMMIEGYPFHARGESGRAIGLTLICSMVAQFASIILMVATLIPLAEIAPRFLAPEIFALAIFGMTAVGSLTGKNPIKGIIAAAFGIALATVGVDPITGQIRFGLGSTELGFGLELVPVILGLLAVSEVLRASRQMVPWEQLAAKFSTAMPSWQDLKASIRPIAIAIFFGYIIGVMPGAGGSAAAFVAWQQAKLFSKEPEKFGKGSIEGLAAASAADNASTGGDLVPTLGLGIPGSTSAAVIMAALIVVGVKPGPLLTLENPEIVQAFFGGLMICTVFSFVLAYLMIRPSITVATLPRPFVMAGIATLVTVGSFAVGWSLFDVFVAYLFGAIGYLMYVYGYPPVAAILGLVLGNIMEMNLRRGLLITDRSLIKLVSRPITATLLILALVTFLYPYAITWWKQRRQQAAQVAAAQESRKVE